MSSSLSLMHVQIINMENQRHKFIQLSERLRQKGFTDINRWPSVVPTIDDVRSACAKNLISPPKRVNCTLGAFLTHAALLEYIANGPHKNVLVLEDDVFPGAKDFVKCFRRFVSKFPGYHVLGCNVLRPHGAIVDDKIMLCDPSLQHVKHTLRWAAAMVVSPEGAKSLLNAIKKARFDMSVRTYDSCFRLYKLDEFKQYAILTPNKYFVHKLGSDGARSFKLRMYKSLLIVIVCILVYAILRFVSKPVLVSICAFGIVCSHKRASGIDSISIHKYAPQTGDIIYMRSQNHYNPLIAVQHLIEEYNHLGLVVLHNNIPMVYDWTPGSGSRFQDLRFYLEKESKKRNYFAVRRIRKPIVEKKRVDTIIDTIRQLMTRPVSFHKSCARFVVYLFTNKEITSEPLSCCDCIAHIFRKTDIRVDMSALFYQKWFYHPQNNPIFHNLSILI